MSLYLKYRPKDFDNLIGQDFIKDTLQSAIKNDKLVSSYLFCGPRGTGKTTTARLLAKTINCLQNKNGTPCNKCDICLGFAEEKLIDIIEIDAASHTGVDNIREIIEKAKFLPSLTKYKVYIIDEVHMLSKGAFNALLKILEEPPAHVKFILATTETHKVPETIISRCQRYDFKRVTQDDIVKRLEYISKQEGIKSDAEALLYIANHSNGGLRNAINLFEQLVSEKELKYEYIVEKLGLLGEKELREFLELLISHDRKVLDEFDKLILSGKNTKLFFKELIFFIKDEILLKIKENKDIKDYLEIIEILDETYSKTKVSLDENITFLVGLIRILEGKNSPHPNQYSPHPNPLPKGEGNKPQSSNNLIPPLPLGEGARGGGLNQEIIRGGDINQKEELTHDDILDTFGVEEIELKKSSEVEDKKEPSPETSYQKELSPEISSQKELSPEISSQKEPSPEISSQKELSPEISSQKEPSPLIPLPKVEGNKEDKSKIEDFSFDRFIVLLKDLGAKGALTLTIKFSEINLKDNVLEIKTTSLIARNTLIETNNQKICKEALEKMGCGDLEIKIL